MQAVTTTGALFSVGTVPEPVTQMISGAAVARFAPHTTRGEL